MSLEEPEKSALKKMLTTPPVKKIDVHFPLGLEVTARNLKGVTIKDALDAIYKQFRKKVCLYSHLGIQPGQTQPFHRFMTLHILYSNSKGAMLMCVCTTGR